MKKILPIVLFLTAGAWAAGKQPPPEILKIKLGMCFTRAHLRLSKIGRFKSENEGQEVWILNHDQRYQYVIVGFDAHRNVRYVTALVRPNGVPVLYEDIGDLASAARFGGSGNLRYTWTVHARKGRFGYEVTAKGKDLHRLDRYSIKRLGIQLEAE